MLKPLLATIAALVVVASAAPARADAVIEARCQATPDGGACRFTNSGANPGSGCATVVVHHTSGTGSTTSAPACSGLIAPAATQEVPLRFVGQLPGALCLTPDVPAEFRCTMAVTMSDVAAEPRTGALASPLLFPVIVLFTSIGVFIDARRIGARKNLVPGFFNLSAGGWFAACLLLWIVGFPAYLITRRKIVAAARA